MKKVFWMLAAAALITSCGGSHETNDTDSSATEESVIADLNEEAIEEASNEEGNSVTEEQVEEESEEAGWKVPFQFQTTRFWKYNGDEYRYVTTYKLLPNGKLKVSETEEEKGLYTNNQWELKKTEEKGGKWSTTRISRGEGLQKVYVIDREDYENSLYLPDDMEYFWNRGSGHDWFDCENYDTGKAVKVENPKKL